MKASSIRQKGQQGERDVAKLLNPIVHKVKRGFGVSEENILNPHNQIGRNHSQAATGGNDLVNTFGLSIEVKRQESLAINTWWTQTIKAAEELNYKPILIYRRNGERNWHVMMLTDLPLRIREPVRVEITMADFLVWFEMWVRVNIQIDNIGY